MKRTTMVEMIQLEYNLPDGMAEDILSFIESKGMLPPLSDKFESDRYIGYSNIQVPEWED